MTKNFSVNELIDICDRFNIDKDQQFKVDLMSLLGVFAKAKTPEPLDTKEKEECVEVSGHVIQNVFGGISPSTLYRDLIPGLEKQSGKKYAYKVNVTELRKKYPHVTAQALQNNERVYKLTEEEAKSKGCAPKTLYNYGCTAKLGKLRLYA